MKYAGVLFDLDGTLLDTAADLGHALNHVMQQHQLPEVSFDRYRPIASNGAKGLLELGFADGFAQINYADTRQQLLDYYFDNICVDTCLFDGVTTYLEQLNENQIPWGIVTNKPGWLTDKLITHFPILRDCPSVVSGDTYQNSKPHPQPLLGAAKELGLDPSRTLYVGDAQRDIDAAHAASMVSVAALYGYLHSADEAKLWRANYEINHIQELSKLLPAC